MELPDDLKYTKEHEWVRLDGNIAIVGLTDYAQEQLGDIVFADLPKPGEETIKDEPFGTVESVKSVSDCFSPVTGKILEINDLLDESPETINQDCYGEGWLVKIEFDDEGAFSELMDNKAYKNYVKEESE